MTRIRMGRRRFLTAMSAGAAAASSWGMENKRPPNILLIVSDDQGFHDLGCYGSDQIQTPNLDGLAKDGVRLNHFYVTWPACTPSRGSLLTGRHPQRNGTYDMFRNDKVDYGYVYTPEEYAVSPEKILGMDEREILLPRIIKQAGYVSGIFGKWDLGMLRRFLPLQRGFDDFYGFVNTGIDYWKHERYGIHSMYRNNQPTKEDYGTYCTYLFEREAIRFIRENRSRPFFCYVPFNAPHIASVLEKPKPVHAPKEFVDLYPEPKNEKEKHRRDYMAAVTCMDAAIGNILKTLEEIGQADNTIVIFFSDNGGSGRADNTPLRGGKSQMFEGGLRVPCIVRWPGVAPQNKVCEEFLTSLEIFPTLCRACGAKPPEDVVLDGFDMRSVLMGKEASSREDMFWERRGDRAARVGHWKWVDSARGSGLYDLSEDIGETRDLSNEKPEILQKIKNRFTAWKQEIERHEPRGPFRDY